MMNGTSHGQRPPIGAAIFGTWGRIAATVVASACVALTLLSWRHERLQRAHDVSRLTLQLERDRLEIHDLRNRIGDLSNPEPVLRRLRAAGLAEPTETGASDAPRPGAVPPSE